MLRRSLLLLLLLATPALAQSWTRWPLRQLLEKGFESTCELLAPDERPDNPNLATRLASDHSNSADALAMAATLHAFEAIRPEGVAELGIAREQLAAAEKLGAERPLVRFARGQLALAEARHAKGLDQRRALLARADDELASVMSASGSIAFYARAARMAVALERGDAQAFRLRYSEALLGVREARSGAELEFRLRVAYERKMGDLGDARAVLRESRFLERTRPPRVRRHYQRWTDADEVMRSYQRRWTLWGLLWSGDPRAALARGHASTGDGWHARIQAHAHLELGDARAALAAARRARNEDPGHASDELVAQALIRLGQLGPAQPVLEHSMRTEEGEGCSRCMALLARVELLTPGREDRGERLTESATRADDGRVETLVARSLVALGRGDHEKANALGALAFSPATREDADKVDRLEEAHAAAMRFGRYEEAEEHAAAFLAMRPTSQRALRLLAQATAKHGDPRAPLLAERLDLPQDGWSHLARGRARADRGDLEGARRDLARAVGLCKGDEKREARLALAGVEQASRVRIR